MAIRKCPQCLAEVPMGYAAAYSDTIECPGCKSPLEVAAPTRHLAIWIGLAVGLGEWWVMRGGGGALEWVLPMVLAFLAYSVTAALLVMLTADLRMRASEPAAPEHGVSGAGDETASEGGHSGHH